jgi:hypothetical protein
MRGLASDIIEHRVIVASLDDVMDRMRQAGIVQPIDIIDNHMGGSGAD